MWINLKCSRSHGQRETLVIVPLGVGPECRPHELGPQRNAAHFSCSIPLRSWLLHSNISATRSLDVADQRSASQLWSGFRHESHANLAHWSGSYLSQSSFWIILECSHTLRYSCLATTQLANLLKNSANDNQRSIRSRTGLYLVLIFRHIQTGAAQKSSSWDFISSASSVKIGFDSTRLATMLGSRKNPQSVLPGHVPKESKITHNFHLTRRAMWHGHLTLNQKQNWLYLVLIFRHSDWSGTEIIILRLHIKSIFCQAWFQFYPSCNHVGFKEKPTERLARSCAKRIVQLMLPKPSK